MRIRSGRPGEVIVERLGAAADEQEADRGESGIAPDLLYDRGPIEPGHLHVKDHEVRLLLRYLPQRVLAIRRHSQVVALGLEPGNHQSSDQLAVVADQDGLRDAHRRFEG